jgi:hypothetical protein
MLNCLYLLDRSRYQISEVNTHYIDIFSVLPIKVYWLTTYKFVLRNEIFTFQLPNETVCMYSHCYVELNIEDKFVIAMVRSGRQ